MCCPVQYSQWTFAAAQHHPLFEHVISLLVHTVHTAHTDIDSLAAQHIGHTTWLTGPGLFTRAVEQYLLAHDQFSIDVGHAQAELVDDVAILPQAAFAVNGYGAPPETPQQKVFVRHHFSGSWKTD